MIYEVVENENGPVIKGTDTEGKVWWIPADIANSDYQTYLASLENLEGNDANS